MEDQMKELLLEEEAKKEEKLKQAQEEEEKRKNPNRLIRSSVSNQVRDMKMPTESMADFEKEIEESFVKVDSDNVHVNDIANANPLSWERLRNMMEEETVITGEITEVTKGGAILTVEGVRGFIPCSRLALAYVEKAEDYLHQEIRVRVIEADEETEKLVLSAREILEEEEEERKNQLIGTFDVGRIVTGTVDSIKEYGAFVKLADGIIGLIHISQITEKRIKSVRAVLKEGQTVTAKIIKKEGNKLSLSMKVLEEEIKEQEISEEPKEYSDGESANTSLAGLLKNIKL